MPPVFQAPVPFNHQPWDHQPGSLVDATLTCPGPLYSYWWRAYNRTGAEVLGQAPEPRRSAARRLANEYDNVVWCAHGCPPGYLGDHMCDHACDNAACSFDKGDCWRKHVQNASYLHQIHFHYYSHPTPSFS